ncbi:hypothetical protein SK128_006084, partial [Halocaridina rubra]
FAALADLEVDLAMSDDDVMSQEHWPHLHCHTNQKLASEAAVSHLSNQASTFIKHFIEHGSDTSSESLSPVAKASKCNVALSQ